MKANRFILGVAMAGAVAVAGCAGSSSPGGLAGEPPAGALAQVEQAQADAAVLDAVASGATRRWTAARPGFYGYVEPGAQTNGEDGACRDFTHTIFIDGRPKRETGRACRPLGGVWKIAAVPG